MNIIKETYNNTLSIELSLKLLNERNFENNLLIYIKKITLLSIIAAIIIFLINSYDALRYYLFFETNIEIINFINYNIGKSVGAFFIYFTSGMLGITLIGAFINFFMKEKLIKTYSKIFYSLEPIILFGAIPILIPGLFVWSIFRFIWFLKPIKEKEIKGTIDQRE